MIDAEHALDPTYARALGIDTDNLKNLDNNLCYNSYIEIPLRMERWLYVFHLAIGKKNFY